MRLTFGGGVLAVCGAALVGGCGMVPGGITIAKDGVSRAVIVVADDAPPVVAHQAEPTGMFRHVGYAACKQSFQQLSCMSTGDLEAPDMRQIEQAYTGTNDLVLLRRRGVRSGHLPGADLDEGGVVIYMVLVEWALQHCLFRMGMSLSTAYR